MARKRVLIFDENALTIFANELKRVRAEKGMSQYDLALESNVPISSIERIETVRVNPTLSTVFALARALNIRASQLLDFDIPEKED